MNWQGGQSPKHQPCGGRREKKNVFSPKLHLILQILLQFDADRMGRSLSDVVDVMDDGFAPIHLAETAM